MLTLGKKQTKKLHTLSFLNTLNALVSPLYILAHLFPPNNYYHVPITDQETISEQDAELGIKPTSQIPKGPHSYSPYYVISKSLCRPLTGDIGGLVSDHTS